MTKKFKWGGLLALVGLFSLAERHGFRGSSSISSFTNLGSVDSITSCGSVL